LLYRKRLSAVHSASLPYIPAFRIVMQDIQYLKDIERITVSGLLNFKRSILIYNYIEEVFKCKSIPFNLPTFLPNSLKENALTANLNDSDYLRKLFDNCTTSPNEFLQTPLKSTESCLETNLFLRSMWKGVGDNLMNAILQIPQKSRDVLKRAHSDTIKTISSRRQSRDRNMTAN
jgi:hypothetical protein